MAASITINVRSNARSARINMGGYQTNENYVTGGFACTADQFGIGGFTDYSIQFTPAIPVAGTSALMANWNFITNKIQYFWVDTTVDGANLVEVPNGTAVGLVFGTWTAIARK